MTDYGFTIKNKLQYDQVDSQFRNFYMVHQGYKSSSINGMLDVSLGYEQPGGADDLIMEKARMIVMQPITGAVSSFEKTYKVLTSGPPWYQPNDTWYMRFHVYSTGGSKVHRWALFSPNTRRVAADSTYGIDVRNRKGQTNFTSDRYYPMKVIAQYSVAHPFASGFGSTVDVTVNNADNWFYLEPFTWYDDTCYTYGPPIWQYYTYTLGMMKINSTTVRLQHVRYQSNSSAAAPTYRRYYVNPITLIEIKNEMAPSAQIWKWYE